MHLQTLQALLSRLQHHKHDIIGIVDPDFEIAYTQIVKRIETLIRLYKDIKKLVETQEPAILLAILEHFVFFKPFLDAHGKQLAADLRVLQAHGFFEYAVKHSLPLADTVRSLDTDALAEAREAFLEDDAPPSAKKPDRGLVNTDIDPELDEEEPATAAEKNKRKRERKMKCDVVLGDYLQMQLEVRSQCSNMVCKGLMSYLRGLPVLVGHQDKLQTTSAYLLDLSQAWDDKVDHLPGDSKCGELLKGIYRVFASAVESPPPPSPSDVRAGRRIIMELAQGSLNESSVAKAVVHYTNCKPVFEISRVYALRGMADDTLLESAKSICGEFESALSALFDDCEVYLNGDATLPALTFEHHFQNCSCFMPRCAAMLLAAEKLSAASLELKASDFYHDLDTMIDVIKVGRSLLFQTDACKDPSYRGSPPSDRSDAAFRQWW